MFPTYLQISPYLQIYRSLSPDLQRRAGCKPEQIIMWKKLFKGCTASFDVWSETARWTEERRTASRRRRRTG
jgi:hypothetical protein